MNSVAIYAIDLSRPKLSLGSLSWQRECVMINNRNCLVKNFPVLLHSALKDKIKDTSSYMQIVIIFYHRSII